MFRQSKSILLRLSNSGNLCGPPSDDIWWHSDDTPLITDASVPPEVPLVTKSLLARPGWGHRATTEAGHWAVLHPALSAEPRARARYRSRRPAESPEPEELCPGSSPPPPPLFIPDTKPLWSPGQAHTRPHRRKAVRAHLHPSYIYI